MPWTTRSGRWRPPRGPHAQSGDKGGPPKPRARLPKGGWELDLGAEARASREGSLASGRAGRGQGAASRPQPAAGPLTTGSLEEVRRTRRRGAPRVGRGARARCAARARRRRGRPGRGAHAGGGGGGGARPPLPPAPPPPPSPLPVLAPGAQRPPPPEPRAAREMAPAWPPRPAEASAGARARDAPGPAAPRAALRRRPSARGAGPRTLSGPGRGRGAGDTAACSGRPTTGGEGGGERKRTAAAISRPRGPTGPPARRPGPGPARRLCPEPENKTRLGGRSARGRGNRRARAAPRRGEMLRHGANMDAGLLSFVAREAQARPGAPRSRLRRARPPRSQGKAALGRAGRCPRLLRNPPHTPISKILQFLIPTKAQT